MQEVQIGMADYVAAFRRRRKLVLAIAIPAAVIAALVAFSLPEIYRSTAYFKLRDTSPDSIRMSFSDQYVYNLRDYVLTEANRKEAVALLQPYPKYRDNPAMAAALVGANTTVEMQSGTILDAGGHNMAINTGFAVSYDNTDPKAAHDVAQWLAEQFTKGQRQEALEKAQAQMAFYGAEADRTGTRVAELEAKVADFRRQNFSALPESAQTNLMVKNQAEQELQNIEREITAQQQNRIFLNSQLQSAQVNSNAGSVGALEDQYKRMLAQYDASHPDVVALRRQIAAAKKGGSLSADGSLKSELDAKRATLNETLQRYSEEYPDVKRLRAEIKSLETRVASGEKSDPGAGVVNTPVVIQLNSQIHATDTQIGSLQVRRAALLNKLSSVQQELSASPIVQREYDLLNRDLGTAKQQYEDLVRRRLEVEVSLSAIRAGNADKFVMTSSPWLPDRPYKPNRMLIVTLGILAGVALAMFMAVGAEMVDSSVRGSKDIGRLLGVTPLAIVPVIGNSRSRIRARREWAVITASAVIGTPLAYFVIRLLVRE